MTYEIEEKDVIEYLKGCSIDEKIDIILASTGTVSEDVTIGESILDSCTNHLVRYKLIDDEKTS